MITAEFEHQTYQIVGQTVLILLLLKVTCDVLNGLRVHLFMVTGCTDGIGLWYARELARRGVNIALVSRSREKLTNLSRQIEHEYQVKTRVIVADFSHGNEIYDQIARELEELEVGILVNNVGVIIPYPMRVEEMSQQLVWEHVAVNVAAATQMSRIVLPAMKARRRGAIVNLSSIAAISPVPLLTVYSSTKVYIEHLSKALQLECRGSGVSVQTLAPSYVNTRMNKYSSLLAVDSLFVPSAETYARHAVSTLGLTAHTTGYLPHGIQYWFCEWCPPWVRAEVALLMNCYFRRQYDRAQKLRHVQSAPEAQKQ